MGNKEHIGALVQLLGEKTVSTDEIELQSATEDWRGRYRGEALCLLRPDTTQAVSKAMRYCFENDIPVIPQGGNTSLCGGAVPDAQGRLPVILNLDRMNSIRYIDIVTNTMDVDAGCILSNIHDAALIHDRFYPVSLGAEGSCQIGGTIATNAGGTSVLRYGNTRENVLGLEVVLADGSIWSGLNRLRKNNTGYDLKQLFIGSEGTLGIITAAVLKMHPLLKNHAMAWVGLTSLDAALQLLPLVQEKCGSQLTAFELLNQLQVDLVVEHVHDRRAPLETAFEWQLLLELSDNGAPQELDAALQNVLEKAFEAGLIEDAVIAQNETQRLIFWEVRHSVSEANKKAGIGLTTDCAVPLSAIPDFIRQATKNVHAIIADLPIIVVGHLGDGNIHFIPLLSFEYWKDCADRDALAVRLRRAVDDAAMHLHGTFSAEHGIGRVSLPEMAHYKSPVELRLMHTIKSVFDKKNLLNPSKLLPADQG